MLFHADRKELLLVCFLSSLLWPAGRAMKTVVGQTEYLYSLMRTAQTRPPTLKFSPALCFLSPLNSKDLCCFEAKGMRKCCLPSYRGIVFPSRWQMAQCPTLSWLEWKMLPISCCDTFLQYWSQYLFLATGSYRRRVAMFLSQFTVKVRIRVCHFIGPGQDKESCSAPFCASCFSWGIASGFPQRGGKLMAAVHCKMNMSGHNDSEHISALQQHSKVDVCRRV